MSGYISLAGRVAVRIGDHGVDERALPGHQPRLVFALLVVERHRLVLRDELAEDLWPGTRPETWETALRGVVTRVRSFLGSVGLDGRDLLRADAGGYRLRLPCEVEVDLERAAQQMHVAEAALAAGDARCAAAASAQARSVLTRPLLPGVHGPWVERKRREVAHLLLNTLEVLAEARLALAEPHHAATVADEAIAADPFRESAHRLLIRAHIAAGNGAAGLRAYEACRRLLAEELGVDPSPETQALHTLMLGGRAARSMPGPALIEFAPARPRDGFCPYRGLQTFEEDDAAHFFGRGADISRLLDRLHDARFLAVLGSSGSGKSSLVRAGLVPALRRGGLPGSDTWPVIVLRPGAVPAKTMTGALARLDPSLDQAALLDRLLAHDLALHEAVCSGVSGDVSRVVFIVDQLEEVFTLSTDEQQRHAFLEALSAAATVPRGPVTVVITMRADFYPRLAEHPRFADLASAHQFLVTPMDEVGLAEAIQGPARAVGLSLEEGLTETILRDVARRPAALPLLSHCLLELWERRVDEVLTVAAYQDAGGVEGALTQRAEAVYLALSPREQATARRILLRLTHPGERAHDARRRVTFSELEGSADADSETVEVVVSRLVEARLLTIGGPPQEDRGLELAHEALIRGWPRLRRWIDEGLAGLLVHRRLTAAAAEWQRLSRDDGVLYRGAQLAEAAAWAERDAGAANSLERAFLEASLALDDMQRRRRLRRLRLTTAALAVGAVVVSALALTASIARDRAEEQRRLAESRHLAAEAVNQLSLEPGHGLTLAIEAVEHAPTREAVAALRQALVTPHSRVQVPGGRSDFAVDPAGARLAVGHWDGTAKMWDVDTGRLVHDLKGHVGRVVVTSFSRNGRLLLTTDSESARIWDVTRGSLVHALHHGGQVTSVSWHPDGRRVITAGVDDKIRIWDVRAGRLDGLVQAPTRIAFAQVIPDGQSVLAWSATDPQLFVFDVTAGRQLTVLEGHEAAAVDARVSPGGRHAVSVGLDATARIWDLETGQQVGVLAGFSDNVFTGRFSPDGQLVIVGDEVGTVRIAEVASGRTLLDLRAHDDVVVDAAFSPDGTVAATVSADGKALVWEVDAGRLLGVLKLDGSAYLGLEAKSVVFTPDGQRLLTRASAVELWDVPARPSRILHGHDVPVGTLAFSLDATLLASGSVDGTVGIWDLASGESVRSLQVPDSQIAAASFGPDGSLATANPSTMALSDREAPPHIWKVATGRHVRSLPVPAPTRPPCPRVCQTTAAAFHPDGRTVLTAGQEGVVRLWDGATGELLRSLENAESPIRAAAVSADGRWVAGAAWQKVPLWDVQTGKIVHVLPAPGMKVAFSPTGRLLAVAGDDSFTTLWEVATGRLVGELRHPSAVADVAWSPDGSFLLTGAGDGAHLWDVASQQHIQSFTARGGTPSVAFAPDSSIIAATTDGKISFYGCTVCGSVNSLLRVARRHVPIEGGHDFRAGDRA